MRGGVDVSATIRAFLLDDHEMVRRGLRELLSSSGIRVVGESGSARQAALVVPGLRPDVAILDVRLPDGSGIDVCSQLRSTAPAVRSLILTSFDDPDVRTAAVVAGAFGFVLKDVRCNALVNAVRAVASGRFLPTDPASTRGHDRSHPGDRGDTGGVDAVLGSLTPQERRLAVHLAAGLTNRQIADLMLLSEKTIKNYLTSVLAKMGMKHRTQVAVYAVQHNWSQ
jgi:two-component system, NarL family, response regulator DevR